ncbi:MAG TPA: hypothetical protein VMY41_17415 [Thermohalobaculum sp.]|nr:hypothetical protein [Thermohalobaculum sp.]
MQLTRAASHLPLAGFCSAGLLGLAAPAAAQVGCPAALASTLASENPVCEFLSQGELHSVLGNSDVAYRLYRWVPTRGDAPSILYDSAPYFNTAVTLTLAGTPGQEPFWSAHYLQGVAWFETPHLAHHRKYGEFLVVPGRYFGTGSLTEDYVFMPNHARSWTQIRSAAFDPDTGRGWLEGLKSYLPPGHGIWKGLGVDYTTLTGTTTVWRDTDANCCPSGGELWFRLQIAGPELGFEIAEARYTPPLN